MTCLIQCFEKKKFLERLSPLELDHFLKLKTITEQFLFLKSLSYVPLYISDLFKMKTWYDMELFCKQVIIDGILLFWADIHYTGHALPVTNGKIEWLPLDRNTQVANFLINLTCSYIKKK